MDESRLFMKRNGTEALINHLEELKELLSVEKLPNKMRLMKLRNELTELCGTESPEKEVNTVVKSGHEGDKAVDSKDEHKSVEPELSEYRIDDVSTPITRDDKKKLGGCCTELIKLLSECAKKIILTEEDVGKFNSDLVASFIKTGMLTRLLGKNGNWIVLTTKGWNLITGIDKSASDKMVPKEMLYPSILIYSPDMFNDIIINQIIALSEYYRKQKSDYLVSFSGIGYTMPYGICFKPESRECEIALSVSDKYTSNDFTDTVERFRLTGVERIVCVFPSLECKESVLVKLGSYKLPDNVVLFSMEVSE